jgi:ornithine carbamoyltransferase
MNLLTLADWDAERIREVLALSRRLKVEAAGGALEPVLRGRTLALLFEKPSMRTRVSFEVAMTQLGGHVTYLAREDVDLGSREPVKDGARVLSRCVDGIGARVYRHETLEELASYASVPVINALSDRAHPCQALADMLTIEERFGDARSASVAYVGDANNVAASLAWVCAKLGVPFAIASPEGYGFAEALWEAVCTEAAHSGAEMRLAETPGEAAGGARVVYTDTWTSMGQEAEAEQRREAFAGFCVDEALLSRAAADAVVMHCLPAHRGEEITDGVMEGARSVVFEQAENRLHAQRGLLHLLLA